MPPAISPPVEDCFWRPGDGHWLAYAMAVLFFVVGMFLPVVSGSR